MRSRMMTALSFFTLKQVNNKESKSLRGTGKEMICFIVNELCSF